MSHTRKRRHKQRGGGRFDWMNMNPSTSTTSSSNKSWTDWWNQGKSWFTGPATNNTNSTTTFPTSTTSYSTPNTSSSYSSASNGTYGGRTYRRRKLRRGGGPALVSGIKVAEPTYWIRGGKTQRRHRRA